MTASSLEDELASLGPEQRREVEHEIALRARSAELAQRLGLDPHDVRQILKCLALSPSERLRKGLLRVRRRTVAE